MSVPADFKFWLDTQIRDFGTQYNIESLPHAFPGWALVFLFEIDPDDAFNSTDTLEQGDRGLDGWHLDDNDGLFYLIQAKYPSDPSTVIPPGGLRDLFSVFTLLQDLDQARNLSKRLGEIAIKLHQALEGGAKPVFAFLLGGGITTTAKNELEAVAKELAADAVVEIFDIDRLYRHYVARETADDLTGIRVEMPLAGPETISLDATSVEGVDGVLVTNLDVRGLGDAVKEYEPRIYERNVRYSLDVRNRVNSGIRATLHDPARRASFWLYNNGLTILADDFSLVDGSAISVLNPQVVNGCQTVSAIVDVKNQVEVGTAQVLARIIRMEQSEAGHNQAGKISLHTNSQNPVKTSDLKGNDPAQVELQAMFQAIDPPWFYERKRGEWASLTPARRATFNGRRVDKTDIGQRWRAFSKSPAAAISKKDEMYADTTVYSETFRPERSAYLYILAHQLFKQLGDLTLSRNRSRLVELAPNWQLGTPTGEALFNRVRRAKRLWTAHLLYTIGRQFDKGYGSMDGEMARSLLSQLNTDHKVLDQAFRLALRVFYYWQRTLNEQDDMKQALQRDSTAAQWRAELESQLGLLDKDVSRLLPTV